MTPCIEEANRLLHLAERDLQTARILLAHPDAAASAIGFHAQQCAEKSLKAVLASHATDFARTHNLEELANLVIELKVCVPIPAREYRKLNPFAVAMRYDDVGITLLTCHEASTIAEKTPRWAQELVSRTGA